MENILELVALLYFARLQNPNFQQGNSRSHAAGVTTECLDYVNINLLPWLSQSLDLSLFEHAWDMIGRRLNSLPYASMP